MIEKSGLFRQDGLELEAAVNAAVDDCIENDRLRELLSLHKAEVINMFMTEYDEGNQRLLDREEGREEGRGEGRKEAIEEMILGLCGELGPVPEEVRQKILAGNDEEQLKIWFMAAAKAKDLASFLHAVSPKK